MAVMEAMRLSSKMSAADFSAWERKENAKENTKKLDDGWPESVEEQGLLLLVWRHHMTKHYIKDVL